MNRYESAFFEIVREAREYFKSDDPLEFIEKILEILRREGYSRALLMGDLDG